MICRWKWQKKRYGCRMWDGPGLWKSILAPNSTRSLAIWKPSCLIQAKIKGVLPCFSIHCRRKQKMNKKGGWKVEWIEKQKPQAKLLLVWVFGSLQYCRSQLARTATPLWIWIAAVPFASPELMTAALEARRTDGLRLESTNQLNRVELLSFSPANNVIHNS